MLLGVLAADAFETPREFVWNDATLPPDSGWIDRAIALETAQALLRSVAEALNETPILMIVREGTLEAQAWERLRPLIPCVAVGETLRWLNAPPPSGSPPDDLIGRVGPEGLDRMLLHTLQILEREGGA